MNTVEIGILAEGFGSWSTWFTDGGVLSVSKGSTTLEIQMLVSASGECFIMTVPILIYTITRRD